MARKNVYLPDELAEELAEYEGFPLSSVCQRAIREELRIMQAVDTQEDMERIEVDVEDDNRLMRTVAFTGRWLVAPVEGATGARAEDCGPGESYDAGTYWGIALTGRGRIAVYVAHPVRDGGLLSDYDDLAEASEAEAAPRSIMAEAKGELTGTVPVVELDI